MAKKRKVNIGNARISKRGDYDAVLKQIERSDFCPFCEEHFGKHHHEPILIRNRSWIVTHNAWPYEGAKRHFLLVARRHVRSAGQLRAEEWADLGAAFRGLEKKYGFPGATLFMRSADTALTGGTVEHLHAQIVIGARHGKDTEPIHAVIGFKRKR
jgi:diadenosine tetraphosphate (Ap4A) HIT family hydrolase